MRRKRSGAVASVFEEDVVELEIARSMRRRGSGRVFLAHNGQQVSLGLGPLCDRGTYLERTMTDDG